MKTKRNLMFVVGLTLVMASATLTAGSVGALTTFTAGTPAKAAEVNGNFATVKTAVDDNAARVGTIESTVSGGNIVLAPSTSTTGNVFKGTERFIHNFGNDNTFVGLGAGNFTTTGIGNTAIGVTALLGNTTGSNNTANGILTLLVNTTGDDNTAIGANAMQSNTTGSFNTANGRGALFFNTTGSSNTAIGATAMRDNTTGHSNTATGANALLFNTTGIENTASGREALMANTAGTENTATGRSAMSANTTGSFNTANGVAALFSNVTGDQNTAIGVSALRNNVGGFQNVASGLAALRENTGGNLNTASGFAALLLNTTGSNNVAVGQQALSANTTGSGNIAVGAAAGISLTTGSNNIAIGNAGVPGESSTIRIGQLSNQTRTFVVGIRGVTTGVANAVSVVIDSGGQLGTINSSRSSKDHIAAMDGASDVLMQLRPVTFYYKSDRNPDGRSRQYGLVAEEVAEVAPDLVAHSVDGKIETVYYQFLAPMLLNEYQKQQRTISKQAARIDALERQFADLAARLAKLDRPALAAHQTARDIHGRN